MDYKFERLEEDGTEYDRIWYATITAGYGNRKNVSFHMWCSVDWARYEAYYRQDDRILTFEENAIQEEKNNIDITEKMIAFIKSDLYKNFEFPTDSQEDFVYIIGY